MFIDNISHKYSYNEENQIQKIQKNSTFTT